MPSEEAQSPHISRLAWQMLEPYHAMIYFAPEARQAYSEAGLKGFWMGYFASRSAAMGAVTAPVVAATFYNFHPRMVARAIPDAWLLSSPEKVLAARFAAADAALRRLLGSQTGGADVAGAAELAREAALACDGAGRPVFAAHSALAWPSEPHMVLWHAATLLREFRGDGHVIALVTEGLDGCEAHLTQIATGRATRELLQPNRGWSDEDWAAAHARLVRRGILDDAGELTDFGRATRQAVEERTDQLALPPWQYLGEEKTARLLKLAHSLSALIVKQGGIPIPNPMGVPWSDQTGPGEGAHP